VKTLSMLALILALALPAAARPDSLSLGWIRDSDGSERPLIPESRPFGVGEQMDFNVRYGMLDIGTDVLRLRRVNTHRGREAWEIVNMARSADWVDRVFKIRDRVGSLMDVERWHSLKFEKKIQEGRYKREMRAEYMQDEGVALYGEEEHPLVPGSQDILSALYLIRSVKLEPGMTVRIPLHDDKKNYMVEVEVLKRERVETGIGALQCLKLEPHLQSDGIFNKAGRLWVWITDDERRLLAQLKSKVPVGAFTSVLADYTPPEEE